MASNTIITSILPCDVSSISFPGSIESSALPSISSPSTLQSIQTASKHILNLDEPIAFPTETVYGLGASALRSQAVSPIFSMKGRPVDNPLIVHVSSLPMLHSILPKEYKIPPTYQKLISSFWPGPLTLLFPADPGMIPPIVTAGHTTVAIRMPSHPVARALIAICNEPLAAPSANSSGKPSPTRAEHVLEDLGGKVAYILDGGPCDVGLESTVVNLEERRLEGDVVKVLRPGGVTVEDIERVLAGSDDKPHFRVLVHRRDFKDTEIESSPTTPGMKYRHYAPSAPVILLQTQTPFLGEVALRRESLPEILRSLILSPHPLRSSTASLPTLMTNGGFASSRPLKVGLLAPSDSPLILQLTTSFASLCQESHIVHTLSFHPLGPLSDPSITAHRLFDGLFSLDREGVDIILIESVAEEREGLAIMNRVKKAAAEVRWVELDSKPI